ncbi:MAG: MarR family transcriptional regulator [Gammaproteobacteria bacterium]|nr:MarR family transcriptional regulator [Gammaproteobacteria bacterium]MCY4343277.1 MarR family transcriptional regulator [Gammaproteobacteria bacterium]
MKIDRVIAEERAEANPDGLLILGLLRAYRWMDDSLLNGMREGGYEPRTRTQRMILVNLSNGITRGASLARALGVSRQAIQLQINELRKDGIVTQMPDPFDRRANRIVFTDEGLRMMRSAQQALRGTEEILTMRLGARAISNLWRVLDTDWGTVIGGQPDSARARPLPLD